LDAPNITVLQSTFTNIQYPTDGGAIFAVFANDLMIDQTRFADISAARKGAVVFSMASTSQSLHLAF
jgi:hypothetical protein